jgi:hypothetical protein
VTKAHKSICDCGARRATATSEGLRQVFPARIKTYTNSIAGHLSSSRQTISKMIQS